jgi:hypothetical protein
MSRALGRGAGSRDRCRRTSSGRRWSRLVARCRPKGETAPHDLRRTLGAILWRHRNGATWRAVPAELGPWWRAAQLFIRRAELGAWQRLLEAAQARGPPRAAGRSGTPAASNSAWRSWTAPASGRARRPRGRPKKGKLAPAGPPGSARALARRVRHQDVRHSRWSRPCRRRRDRARPSARAAAGAGAARPSAAGAALGRGRPRLQLQRLASAHLGQRRASGDPDPKQRGGRRPPRLHPPRPQPGRAALGAARGPARGRDPLREDRRQLPGRAPSRRDC